MLEQERNLQVSHDGGGEVRGHDWRPQRQGQWGLSGLVCPFFQRCELRPSPLGSLTSLSFQFIPSSYVIKHLLCVKPGFCPQGTRSLVGEVAIWQAVRYILLGGDGCSGRGASGEGRGGATVGPGGATLFA